MNKGFSKLFAKLYFYNCEWLLSCRSCKYGKVSLDKDNNAVWKCSEQNFEFDKKANGNDFYCHHWDNSTVGSYTRMCERYNEARHPKKVEVVAHTEEYDEDDPFKEE